MALAGFLRCSRQLIICWTPNYLTRLWCIYEIASWLHLGKPLESMHVLPTPQSIIMFMMMIFFSTFYAINMLFHILLPDQPWLTTAILVCLYQVPMVICSQFLARTLAVLPRQMESFSTEEAQCFCCSNQHIMPRTGESLPCDRKLIYDALIRWFSEKHSSQNKARSDKETQEKDALKVLDNFVKTELAPWFLQQTSGFNAYGMMVIGCSPALFSSLDMFAALGSVSLSRLLRLVVLEWLVVWSLVLPMTLRLMLWTLSRLDMVTHAYNRPCLDMLLAPVRVLVSILIFVILWVPLCVANENLQSILPVLTIDCFLACLAVHMFGGKLPNLFHVKGDGHTGNSQISCRTSSCTEFSPISLASV